ncbi:hypothetical protein M422DRAFT_87052, partial [Sphaerobolus stellatus SS14]
ANQVMKNGMHIAHQDVHCCHLVQEPRRCLKCQKLMMHIAVTCSSLKDICRTCGGNHWTRDCREPNSNKWNCQNCNCSSHASWDRNCPSFQRRIEE